jgi:acetylornithine deacetylase
VSGQVDPGLVAARTLELVEVPSPTGDTADAARLYASWLEEAGLEVELHDEVFPATPTVVGLLRGDRPGPRIVLNGHLDTVPIPHDGPARIEGDRIYGRGSADMKGACVAALETARVLAGQSFAGELAVVAIGLHEAPGGRGEDLTYLLGEGGFSADMAVVCELSGHNVAVAHMGQATAEIEITRPGMPTHELQTPKGTPHPLLAAARVIDAVSARSRELSEVEHPWVGAETYFVGEVHGGDFYNRHPTRCRIVGTRRWAPGNTLAAVEAEYRALLDGVAAETGCDIALDLRLVRGAYEIELDHPLLAALRESYLEVTGKPLEPVGIKVVADGAIFHQAGIPTVYHGPVGSGAHADVEYMAVGELVRATEVYLALLGRLLNER